METTMTNGRKAWRLSNGETELSVTELGGHMAPVRFFADTDSLVEPYYISPWQEEGGDVPGPGVLGSLRGDFFCMPFGGDNSLDGDVHPPHGEVSEAAWTFDHVDAAEGGQTLALSLETRIRPGRVMKKIGLKGGQSALYICHEVEGFAGPVTLGHHAIMPGDRTHFVDTRPLITGFCDTAPPPPSSKEYYWAAPGAFFDSLEAVPTIWKDPSAVDASVFPGLEGFVNVLQVFPEKPGDGTPLWITAAVPSHGYLWYSLKDPDLLPSTVLWQEHHGRHGAPWNGRNSCMGIEEVRAHLASGLGVSVADNALTGRGLDTSMHLDGRKPLEVRNIQGICRIPEGFDRVADVEFREDSVRFISRSGSDAVAAVNWSYVLRG